MTFGWLPTAAVLAGLAVIAGVLYALQRLRVRHRDVPVVTTLFWKAAVEESRARVLTERFRHPLAYALVLLIASLVWLGLARPQFGGSGGTEHVVLLDGSAAMGVAGRFDIAREAVAERVASLPGGRTSVVFAGGAPRTLLRPDEDRLLLHGRLARVGPEACPTSLVAAIHELAAGASASRPLAVHVVGDGSLDALGPLPTHVTVTRTAGGPPALAGNRGVTALGIADAASGAYDRVDVLVEARGDGVTAETLAIDGVQGIVAEELAAGDDVVRLRFVDVPADGRTITATVSGGGPLDVDDRAVRTLPRRPRIRVRIAAEVGRLAGVLAADPAVAIVEGEADVVVGTAVDDAPCLALVPESDAQAAFVIRHTGARGGDEVLTETFGALALDRVDAGSLADAAGRPVRLDVRPGRARGVFLWASLATERYDLVHSRAFPALVGGAVRWLAGAPDVIPFADAGIPLPATGAPGRVVPPTAGSADVPGAGAVSVCLSDVASTVGWSGADAVAADAGGVQLGSAVTWMVLVAFVLLLVEWTLYRTGRMP